MNKFKPHKGCSCKMCKHGKRGRWGHFIQNYMERVFRRKGKAALKKDPESYVLGPNSMPYTD